MKPWIITVALIGASLVGWTAHDDANYAEQDAAYERGRLEGARQADELARLRAELARFRPPSS